MKQEDFERLKKLCQDNDFEIDGVMNNEGVYFIKKKDPWDGVEFVECLQDYNGYAFRGRIYKVKSMDSVYSASLYEAGYCDGIFVDLRYFHPSTESAYINQLKNEAFERFGEIKEGDRFDQSIFGYSIETINYQPWNGYEKGFNYKATSDSLYFDNLLIYKSGKWATRVKERVEVELDYESFGNNNTYYFKTQVPVSEEKLTGSGEFLAKQLEEYLNKE